MAIAVDSSSPALVTDTDSAVTTPSFTAPANSFLVALCSSSSGVVTHTVSDSSTLTWTSQVKRDIDDSGGYACAVEVFTAPAVASVSRTVTLSSNNGGDTIVLKLLVFTGVDLTDPVGATGEGSSATDNIAPTVYTSTAAGSRAAGVGSDTDHNGGFGSPTSTDTEYGWDIAPDYGGIAVHKAADTPSAGAGVTLNFDSTTSAAQWNWAAIEILALPDVPRPVIVHPVTAVHRAAAW